jgi:hypothetical protein
MAQPTTTIFDDLLGFDAPPKPPPLPDPIMQQPVKSLDAEAGKMPTVDDEDTKARMAAAEATDRNRRKKTNTLLTGAQGVLEAAPTAIKTLFGN